jgi:hypothetical protein
MSLLSTATKMGVTTSALQDLINGHVPLSIAAQLGVTASSLQQFIDGSASVSTGRLFSVTSSGAQDLRNQVGKNGAIGLIIGLCIGRNEAGGTDEPAA